VGIGSDFDNSLGQPAAGATSGTSFAAPFVAGTVALMQEYAAGHNVTHDADAIDSRVMRAVVMNTATTGVQHLDGGAWPRGRRWCRRPTSPRGTPSRSTGLWTRSWGGPAQCGRAMEMYARAEVRAADNATSQNVRITVTAAGTPASVPMFWDRQEVRAADNDGPGTVTYTLGTIAAGAQFRATLAWLEFTTNVLGGGTSSYLGQLQLWLFLDGTNQGTCRALIRPTRG